MTGQASKHIHCIDSTARECLSAHLLSLGRRNADAEQAANEQHHNIVCFCKSLAMSIRFLRGTFSTPLMYSDHHRHKMVGKKLLYSKAEDA